MSGDMNRNIVTSGVIVKAQAFMEADRKVTLLTPDHGLLEAVVYGIGKGKGRLSSATDLLSLGTYFLYLDPVKQRLKVRDSESSSLFQAVKADLYRFYRAVLWIEIILKSLGGSETYASVFSLLVSALTALEAASSREETDLVQLQFLWRYIALQGYTIDGGHCSRCGRLFEEREPVFHRTGFDPFLCGPCTGIPNGTSDSGCIELSPGGRRYLVFTSGLDLPESLRVRLEPSSVRGAENLLLSYIQEILESSLSTLGILGGLR